MFQVAKLKIHAEERTEVIIKCSSEDWQIGSDFFPAGQSLWKQKKRKKQHTVEVKAKDERRADLRREKWEEKLIEQDPDIFWVACWRYYFSEVWRFFVSATTQKCLENVINWSKIHSHLCEERNKVSKYCNPLVIWYVSRFTLMVAQFNNNYFTVTKYFLRLLPIHWHTQSNKYMMWIFWLT